MEKIIAEHLQVKFVRSHSLLNSFLPFKLQGNRLNHVIYSNDEYSEYISFGKKFMTKLFIQNQTFTFPSSLDYGIYTLDLNKTGNLEIKVSEDEDNYRFLNMMPQFEFNYDNTNISYCFMGELLFFNLTENLTRDDFPGKCYYIGLSRDGRLNNLFIGDNGIILQINMTKNNFTIGGTDSTIEELKEFYRQSKAEDNIIANLILECYPDKSIKKYGIMINQQRDGFFYELDEFGNVEHSCYVNGKLHGYYFNGRTKEQGFYEHGIKVGFWKEGSNIVNYNNSKIYFPFPVFLM